MKLSNIQITSLSILKYFINRSSWLTVFTGTTSTGSADGGDGTTPDDESCPDGGGGGGGGGGGPVPNWVDSLILLFKVWILLFVFELVSFSNFKFLISSTELSFCFKYKIMTVEKK